MENDDSKLGEYAAVAAPFEAPVANDAAVPDTVDENGHDLSQYDWVPVLRKRRSDGWSPEKQRNFIEALADCGSVDQAAFAVNMSRASAYKLRRSPGAEAFDRAWSAAIDTASKKLIDEAFERALVGSDEPVFDRDGRRVGRRLRQSDKMLMFLLRAYMPERFRHAVNDRLPKDEPVAPDMLPVAEALDRLLPEPPSEPHRLMNADDLDVALQIADMCDGELPHWHRDPEPEVYKPNETFERELENAKRAASGAAPATDEEWAELWAVLSKNTD